MRQIFVAVHSQRRNSSNNHRYGNIKIRDRIPIHGLELERLGVFSREKTIVL